MSLEIVPRGMLQELPPPRTQRLVSIDNLWEVHVRMRGDLAPSTLAQYRDAGRKFCAFARDRDLSPQSMVEWIDYLKNEWNMSPARTNRTNVTIRSFLRWLKTMGYLREDLSDAVPTIASCEAKESLIITEEEYERIKAYCTGRTWCQVHLWLCILAYRTGMSLVDCCHLRWRDVHLDDNGPSYIKIYRIKTRRLGAKALCHIPIIPFTDFHYWLMMLKRAEKSNYIRHDGITDFVHQDAPGLYCATIAKISDDFKRIFTKANVGEGKTFRHFRNSFCSNLVNSGTQIALVCKMTGHNNVKTLLRYLKPDLRSLQDGLAKAYQFATSQAGVGLGHDGIREDEAV